MIGLYVAPSYTALEVGPVFAGRRCRILTIRRNNEAKWWGDWGVSFSWSRGPCLWLHRGHGTRYFDPVHAYRHARWKRKQRKAGAL